MPGLNPDSTEGPTLRTMYRGGLFCALEGRFFEAGFLFSKLMREWERDGLPNTVTLKPEDIVNVGGKDYRKPILASSFASLFHTSKPFVMDFGDGPKEYTFTLSPVVASTFDAHSRSLHAISSGKVTQNEGGAGELKIGNSAYVSLTDDLTLAKGWMDSQVHRFEICSNDLFKGNELEREWLAMGGTPIKNVFRSTDRGSTWKKLS